MINFLLLTLIPFLTLFVSELIHRGSFVHPLLWMISFPVQFLVSYCLIFGLINTFFILPRRMYSVFGALFATLFSLLGIVSRQKLLLRGEPLLPWDFSLGKEALNISQTFEQFPLLPFLLILTAVILSATIYYIFLTIPREKYQLPQKVIISLLSFTLFFSLLNSYDLESTFSLRLINWNQKMNYEENGAMLGFILNSKYLAVERPCDYEKDAVQEVLGKLAPAYQTDAGFSPNIIIVMSEAFWDPTVLEGISFSTDPIPFFHSLRQEQTDGLMLAPVYGGGTANTEFEVLTGLSTQFLPPGMVPYVQALHQPLEALPTMLRKQGYESTAIHTYDNWFYRRNIVYQHMGFDRFISKEFFADPEYYGDYIRDTELSQKILEVLEQTDEPDFIFALSMQGHGPYSSEENPESPIKIGGNLKQETKAILENYTNTIADVDYSLRLLIEGLESIEEPSIVVFFGDHLPLLGNDFDVYRETGYFSNDSTYEDYLKKYTVPFVVWDNFSNTRDSIRLSSSFLCPYLLERAMKEGNPLTDFLSTLNEKDTNVITVSHYLQNEDITEEELSQYRLLQYDLLIGNRYTYIFEPIRTPTANPFYVIGFGPAHIESVAISEQSTFEVCGRNFSPHHQIYVNDRPVTTDYVSDTLLKGILPLGYSKKQEAIEIQVKLTDSLKNIISESNTYSKQGQ